MKLNDTQFDAGKLIFLFKSLPIDKNALHKPLVPLIDGIFDYILLSCRTATIKLHHMFRSKKQTSNLKRWCRDSVWVRWEPFTLFCGKFIQVDTCKVLYKSVWF